MVTALPLIFCIGVAGSISVVEINGKTEFFKGTKACEKNSILSQSRSASFLHDSSKTQILLLNTHEDILLTIPSANGFHISSAYDSVLLHQISGENLTLSLISDDLTVLPLTIENDGIKYNMLIVNEKYFNSSKKQEILFRLLLRIYKSRLN